MVQACLWPRAVLVLTLALVGCVMAATSGSAKDKIEAEINCLALTIYFEARSEPDLGKHAVGHVVLNRVSDPKFPGSICEVTQQGGSKKRYACQFSWWCDGRSDEPTEATAWEDSQRIAHDIYWGYSDDPTEGAMWYHASYAQPHWRKIFVRGPKIGDHVFYLAEDDKLTRHASRE